jgi:hypothetical protein
LGKGIDSTRITSLTQGLSGPFAKKPVIVMNQTDQRTDNPRLSDLFQSLECINLRTPPIAFQALYKRFDPIY